MRVQSPLTGGRSDRRALPLLTLTMLLTVAGLLGACSQGVRSASPALSASADSAPSASGPGLPTPAASASDGAGSGSATPGEDSPETTPSVDPTASSPAAVQPSGDPAPSAVDPTAPVGGNPLAALTGVPKGFTLPPGAKVQRAAKQATTSIVTLTAPDASVAVPYLRAELAHLGYAQVVMKTTGSIIAYGYKSGDSLISLSGGILGGLSLTAIIFATSATGSAVS